MARLRATVPVTAWLLITLAVIVCLGHSVSAARDFKEILKNGFKASPEHRTDDDWRKLGTTALEEIQKRGGKVRGNVEKWLLKLTGVSRGTDCSDEVAANLVSWRSVDKKFKKFHAVLDDYLKLYLDECGLEDRFKAAVDKLKQVDLEQWSSGKYKTLRKYLRGRNWSVSETRELLSVVNNIMDLESNVGETNCTNEHMDTVVGEIISGRRGAAPEFLDGCGRLYLDKCGFAARFERAIDTLKQVDPERWSKDNYRTLHGYLKTRGPHFTGGMELFSVVNDILELDSNPGKANCTVEYMIPLVMQRIRLARGDILWFQEGYSGLHLKKCGFDDDFKRVIGVLKQVSPRRWRSYPHETMYGCFKAKNWFRDDVIGLHVFRYIFPLLNDISQFDSYPEKTDCSFKHMLSVLGERIRGSSDDEFILARNDYAKLYLEKCGYEKLFKKAIDELKQISPEHWSRDCYKTLWGYLESAGRNFHGEIDLLSIVIAIAKVDSINEETDCTDERMITVVMMESYAINREFMDDYSKLYSRKCGFEDLFVKAVANVEKVSSKHWQSAKFPTLIGYLRLSDIISAQVGLLRLLPAIREISKPESITGDIDCSEKRVAQVSDWFVKCTFNHELYDFLSGYSNFYKEKCKL